MTLPRTCDVCDAHVAAADGAGSGRGSLVGGNLATAAARNGWAGVVVHGAVRDAAELRAQQVGVAALARCPQPAV